MPLPDYTSQQNQGQGRRHQQPTGVQAGSNYSVYAPGWFNTDANNMSQYTPQADPNYNPQHPYFDPNYSYGGAAGHQNTAFFNIAANSDPQAYYGLWLGQNGYDANGAQAKVARGLYQRYQQGYGAAQLLSPELTWKDYLGQQNIGNDINSMSLENTGVDTGRYTGRDRWGLRGG